MGSRDVEINLIAHDRTGAATRSAARNLEQLARKTEKIKAQKLKTKVDVQVDDRAVSKFANRFSARAKKIFGRGGQRSGAAFLAGFLKTVTFGQIGQGFARGAIKAAPAAARLGGALGAAMAGALVLELTQALSAAVPLALGGLLLAPSVVFLLKQQTEGMKQIKIQDKRVASIKKQIAAAQARDARTSGRSGDSAKAKQARQDHINDLKKALLAEQNIRAEYVKQAGALNVLKAKAKNFLTFVSAPVKVPLANALKAIGDGFDQLRVPFREFTEALGPALAPFAKGVMQSLGSFLGALKPALPGIVAGFSEWSRVMPQLTASVGTLLAKLSAHPEAVQGFADSFDTFLGTSGDVIVGLQGITEKYSNFEALIRGGRTGQWGKEWTKTSGLVRTGANAIAKSSLFVLRNYDDMLQGIRSQPGTPFQKLKDDTHAARLAMEAEFAAMTAAATETFNKFESNSSKIAGFKNAINVLKTLKSKVQEALKDPSLSKPARFKLELDSHHFDAQLAIKRAQLHAFQGIKTKPKLEADKTALEKVIRQANADLKKTHNKKTKPKIEADKRAAEEALAEVNRKLKELDGKSATVTVTTHFKTTGTPAQAWLRKQANLKASAGDGWGAAALDGGAMHRTGGPTPVNVAAPNVSTRVFLDSREIAAVVRSAVVDENKRNTYRARVGRRA